MGRFQPCGGPRFKPFQGAKTLSFAPKPFGPGGVSASFPGRKSEAIMPRMGLLLALGAALALCGCYSDQKKQLAGCEAGATRAGSGQPLRSIRTCMDQAGYNFVGFANPDGETVECDLASVIQGKPSALGTDAQCFEPKGKLALQIYRWQVPQVLVPATTTDQSGQNN
jgi:hypothetical protein